MIDWVKRESKRSGAPENLPPLESSNLGRGEFGETGNTLMEEPSEMESLSIPPPVPMRQNSTSSVSNVRKLLNQFLLHL